VIQGSYICINFYRPLSLLSLSHGNFWLWYAICLLTWFYFLSIFTLIFIGGGNGVLGVGQFNGIVKIYLRPTFVAITQCIRDITKTLAPN